MVQNSLIIVYGVWMARRRLRRKTAKVRRHSELSSVSVDELVECRPVEPAIGSQQVPPPAVRAAHRVVRLTYTRAQAAAALGVSPTTFTRRVLPLIEMIEMPWGTRL